MERETMSEKNLSFLAAVACLLSWLAGAPLAIAGDHLRLATTTSTESSGLLAELLPPFERANGIKVDVIAVGSGKALKLAENGDADVVLSHAPELEEPFVAAGYGVNRRDVMYNDFVIVGPSADAAKIRGLKDAAEVVKRLASSGVSFVSRADESGTHQKEKQLWAAAEIRPQGPWYLEAGQGMGEVLIMASERKAYTLADRGTWIAFRAKLDLSLLVDGDPRLRNPYTIIAANPALHPHVKHKEAMALIAFVTGPEGQKIIGSFRKDGEVLFHPTASPEQQ